eukprot:gene1321-5538_t
MQEWWREVGRPAEWLLVNWGEDAVEIGEGRVLGRGECRQRTGQPEEGWEAGGKARGRVALLVEGPPELEAGERRLCAINLQGWGEDSREGLARWAQRVEADWVIGSEHKRAEWVMPDGKPRRRFAGYATRATCLPASEGGGSTGGVVHFYPREWEGRIDWWEPMAGRILVAQLGGARPTWIVGAYSPAQDGEERKRFWGTMRMVREEAAKRQVRLLAGGDWIAVSNPVRDRNERGPGKRERRAADHQGDSLIGPAMRTLHEVTEGSGHTYRAPPARQALGGGLRCLNAVAAGAPGVQLLALAAKRRREGREGGGAAEGTSARIDSWWASERDIARWDPQVSRAEVTFSRHLGVGIVAQFGGEQERTEGGPRVLRSLPAAEEDVWEEFRARVGERVRRDLEAGGGGDEVLAAWNLAAREVIGERSGGQAEGKVRKLPERFTPVSTWGLGVADGGRTWRALKEIQRLRGVEEELPQLKQGGKQLPMGKVLEEAEKKWGSLYRHPRGRGEGWDEGEWKSNLDRVRQLVGRGRTLGVDAAPPTWEEFKEYVSRLPGGRGGGGFLRYEMLKRADESQLRVWYDSIIVPVVRGTWDPARAVKEAELVLLSKGKGD